MKTGKLRREEEGREGRRGVNELGIGGKEDESVTLIDLGTGGKERGRTGYKEEGRSCNGAKNKTQWLLVKNKE